MGENANQNACSVSMTQNATPILALVAAAAELLTAANSMNQHWRSLMQTC